jgi:hypothetical protein
MLPIPVPLTSHLRRSTLALHKPPGAIVANPRTTSDNRMNACGPVARWNG